jgi:predicted nucleic acid-binding protein
MAEHAGACARLDALRGAYLARCRARAGEVERLARGALARPPEEAAARELRRIGAELRDTGARLGLPDLGEAGRALEEACGAVLAGSGAGSEAGARAVEAALARLGRAL